MDKVQAEAILELNEPYDYAALRSAWRKLCADYHPDKCVATGMDRSVADGVLKDVNEAFEFLKPLVKTGATVAPGEDRGGSSYGNPNQYAYDPSYESAKARAYDAVMLEILTARTADDYDSLVMKLDILGDYRDARKLMQRCLLRAISLRDEERLAEELAREILEKEHRNEEKRRKAEERRRSETDKQYEMAVDSFDKARTAEDYRRLEPVFKSFGNYRDTEYYLWVCRQRMG